MFEDTEWSELERLFPTRTGLLEEDGVTEGTLAPELDDPDVVDQDEAPDAVIGVIALRADGRKRSEDDDDLDEDELEDEEGSEDEESPDDDFDEDLEDDEDLDEEADEEPAEDEDL